mgnify:CR=1 FL=1|tara:strand:- start:240 stop:728 length:489 start_codon:yes stop_codon:yes gene_type:complete
MIIIDNYFNNIEVIRSHALIQDYKLQHFGGYRTPKLTRDTNVGKLITNKIVDTLQKEINKNISYLEIYYHCSPYSFMESIDNFNQVKYHRDGFECAGVVYITPNPPQNTGTCIEGYGCIENVYNRFVCYDSNLLHGPDNLFGFDLPNSRLTVTFFSNFHHRK